MALSLFAHVRSAALALMLGALACLAACAAPSSPTAPAQSADPAAPAAPAAQEDSVAVAAPVAPAPPATQSPGEPPLKHRRTGGPLPPSRIDEPKLPPEIKLDTSCRSAADCTVKNVGNCCGEYPACVNVNSPTDPKGVQARCAQSGMSAVCGFPQISACSCVKGTCQAAAGNAIEETTR